MKFHEEFVCEQCRFWERCKTENVQQSTKGFCKVQSPQLAPIFIFNGDMPTQAELIRALEEFKPPMGTWPATFADTTACGRFEP